MAAFLFGVVDVKETIALMFLLVGVWTVVAAFSVVPSDSRMFYTTWGVVLALLSLTDFVRLRYALGAILVAIVVLTIYSVARKKPAPPAPQPAS